MVRISKQVVSNADLNVSVFIEHYELPVSLSKLAYRDPDFMKLVISIYRDYYNEGPLLAVPGSPWNSRERPLTRNNTFHAGENQYTVFISA
jgi:hypothetical protein